MLPNFERSTSTPDRGSATKILHAGHTFPIIRKDRSAISTVTALRELPQTALANAGRGALHLSADGSPTNKLSKAIAIAIFPTPTWPGVSEKLRSTKLPEPVTIGSGTCTKEADRKVGEPQDDMETQEEKRPCRLLQLPLDLWHNNLLAFIGPADLVRLSLCCRELYKFGSHEIERRCIRLGFRHPLGERAWDLDRAKGTPRRRSTPRKYASPRKPRRTTPKRVTPRRSTPGGSRGDAGNRSGLVRGISFLERMKQSGFEISLPARPPGAGDADGDVNMDVAVEAADDPFIVPMNQKRLAVEAKSASVPHLCQVEQPRAGDIALVAGRRRCYYRRKYFEKVIARWCSVCGNRNGYPHPFFDNHAVCKRCFDAVEYGFLSASPGEEYVFPEKAMIYQIHNAKVPAPYIGETSFYERALSVPVRMSLHRLMRFKISEYTEALNMLETGNIPVTAGPLFDEEEDEPYTDPSISPRRRMELLKRKVDESRRNLYNFCYSRMETVQKHSKATASLLRQTIPLLQNPHLWR